MVEKEKVDVMEALKRSIEPVPGRNFMHEIDKLTEEERIELAQLAAKELGVELILPEGDREEQE